VHECRLGSACGIAWCALFINILLNRADFLFMLVEGWYMFLLLYVLAAKLYQVEKRSSIRFQV